MFTMHLPHWSFSVGLYLSLLLRTAGTQSHEDLLEPLPAAFADTPVVLLRDNLAVIPGDWESIGLKASWHDSNPTHASAKSAFEKVKAAHFTAWDESFLDVIGPGAKVEKIQSFDGPYQVHEAPVYLPASNELLYSDTSIKGYLWAIHVDTHEVRKVVTTPALDNVNGGTLHNGKIYLVNNGGNIRGLYSLDVISGQAETLLNNFRGRRFNSPNDLIFDSQSNILFTDPSYGFVNDWPEVKEPELPNAIYHFDTATKAVTALSNSIVQMPNGLALSLDESELYIADSNSSFGDFGSVRNVWAFSYNARLPSLSNPRLLYQAASGAPDGLRVTESGLLMVTGAGGIDVVDSRNGRLLGKVNTPDDIIYNLEPAVGKGVWLLTGGNHIWKVTIREGGKAAGVPSPKALGLSAYFTMLRDYFSAFVNGQAGSRTAGGRNHGDL